MRLQDHDRDELLLHFGMTVRAARSQRGLSQEQLADLAGLHRTYVGSLERGERNVALVNIVSLARALGMAPAALLTDLA